MSKIRCGEILSQSGPEKVEPALDLIGGRRQGFYYNPPSLLRWRVFFIARHKYHHFGVTEYMPITAHKISKPKRKASAQKSKAENIIALAHKHFSSVPKKAWEGLPTDLAKNADHYLYEHPKEK